jgi:hypothetical protein
MAKLDAAARKHIPAGEFGLPKQRKYPMNDHEHQVLAKGRATEMERKGKLSASSAEKIRSKANRLLGR